MFVRIRSKCKRCGNTNFRTSTGGEVSILHYYIKTRPHLVTKCKLCGQSLKVRTPFGFNPFRRASP